MEGEDSCARITTVDHRRDVVVSGAGPLSSRVGARGVGVVLEPGESFFGDGEHGDGRLPRESVESGAHDRLELVEGGDELGGWRPVWGAVGAVGDDVEVEAAAGDRVITLEVDGELVADDSERVADAAVVD